MAKKALIAIFLSIAAGVSAGTFQLESQNAVFGEDLNSSASGYFSSGKNTSVFFLVSEKYAEGYLSFGRTAKIGNVFIAADAGLGVEQTKDGFGRMNAASVFAKQGNVSFLGVVEYGKGLWYKSHVKWHIVPQVSLGILAQRYAGIGPRIDIRIPRTPITIWGAALRDKELGRNGGIVAITAGL